MSEIQKRIEMKICVLEECPNETGTVYGFICTCGLCEEHCIDICTDGECSCLDDLLDCELPFEKGLTHGQEERLK